MLKNKFIIVMPVWNAENLIIDAVKSVINQKFDDFAIIIRDDMSSDKTHDTISNWLHKQDLKGAEGYGNGVQRFHLNNCDIFLIKNNTKLYPCGNTYESILHYVDNNNAVVGVVDGDDELIGDTVLKEVYSIYEKQNAYVVYTNYKHSTGQIGHCAVIEDTANYRNKGHWNSSHFRTARAALYKNIKKEDLMFEGEYFKFAGDLALMYSLVEQAGNDRTIFYDKVCYLYNNNTGNNEHTKNVNEQRRMAGIIQSQNIYKEVTI